MQLKQLQGPLSLRLNLDGQLYLYFSGTAYLGIPQNEDFRNWYVQGLKKYGLNNGTSRGNNIQQGIYDEAEAYAASYFGAPAALITSSGYMAAQLAVKSFSTYGRVLYAPQTHPALWQNGQPDVSFPDFAAWAKNTVSQINQSHQKHWVLISNSLNNLFPELYDFSFLQKLLPDKEIVLIVDDAHGIGILNGGRGILNLIQAPAQVRVVVVASMAKALGVDAGIILAGADIIAQLKQRNEFLGASPPAAAGLYAFMQAGNLYQEALGRLHENMAYFGSQLDRSNWLFVADYPVYFSRDEALYQHLLKNKVLISSFPYPDQDGPVLNRVVMSSMASRTSIDQLLEAINND